MSAADEANDGLQRRAARLAAGSSGEREDSAAPGRRQSAEDATNLTVTAGSYVTPELLSAFVAVAAGAADPAAANGSSKSACDASQSAVSGADVGAATSRKQDADADSRSGTPAQALAGQQLAEAAVAKRAWQLLNACQQAGLLAELALLAVHCRHKAVAGQVADNERENYNDIGDSEAQYWEFLLQHYHQARAPELACL